MNSPEYDVIVVGAGNAALCAALSAREHGARVVVLECAPEAESGGNSGNRANDTPGGAIKWRKVQVKPLLRGDANDDGRPEGWPDGRQTD
jgi:glycine/D-amino acid oxidase-like deaminating enzyme